MKNPPARIMAVFTFTKHGYSCCPAQFKRSTNRKGVTTVCSISRGSKVVAKLIDDPCSIVAKIEWVDETERDQMLKVAKTAVKAPLSTDDSYLLSDFLRQFTMAADAAWVNAPTSQGGLKSRKVTEINCDIPIAGDPLYRAKK